MPHRHTENIEWKTLLGKISLVPDAVATAALIVCSGFDKSSLTYTLITTELMSSSQIVLIVSLVDTALDYKVSSGNIENFPPVILPFVNFVQNHYK